MFSWIINLVFKDYDFSSKRTLDYDFLDYKSRSFWIINPTFRKPWIISRGLVISAILSLDYKLWIITPRIVKFCGHNRLQVDFCLGYDFSGL